MLSDEQPPQPGSVNPGYADDGIDVTLIRWMLSLTAAERLEVLQASASSLERLRQAVRIASGLDAPQDT